MAVLLGTSETDLGRKQFSGDSSYYYFFYAKYEKLSARAARITVSFRTYGTGSETCSLSGVKFNASVDGESKSKSGLSFSVYKKAFSGYLGDLTFDIEYGSDGKWANKSITCSLSGGNGTYSGGSSIGTGASSGTLSETISLPDLPTGTVASAVYQNGFNGYTVANHSTIRSTVTYANAKKVTIRYLKDGVTSSTYTLLNASSQGNGTAYHSYVPPSSPSDYVLTCEATLMNDYGSTVITTTHTVKGYSLPTYSTSGNDPSQAFRSDSSGTASSQGLYGKLHLKWDSTSITPIDTNDPNSLTHLAIVVDRNGTQETLYNGVPSGNSIDLVFPLAANVQGNLIVTFQDEINSNVVTSLIVLKTVAPYSGFQDGDSVGFAVGRMATDEGFWCYLEFYLLGDDGHTVYQIHVDSNGNLLADAV